NKKLLNTASWLSLCTRIKKMAQSHVPTYEVRSDIVDNSEAWRILIVEDDERLAELTKEYHESNGLIVNVEENGTRAIERIQTEQPDLVVLDLMLPGEDGLSICRKVRPNYTGPILMLTARTDDLDQVLGLEMGAD